jgi:hypothetical protein
MKSSGYGGITIGGNSYSRLHSPHGYVQEHGIFDIEKDEIRLTKANFAAYF